jgi:ribosomal protein S18 acetylase RimI-like enzyme
LGEDAVERDAIRYEVLQAADAESMIELLAAAFSGAEPPAVAMGLSSADLAEFLHQLAPRAVADGLTIVARSSAPDAVAGVVLCDDFAATAPVDRQRISRRFLPIFAMLESLDEQYRLGRAMQKGEYLHLFMLAVDGGFGGRGIAQGLVEFCLQNGARKGYRRAVTEATGPISQHVFRKLGFQERFRVSYGDFRFKGKAAFASITDHGGAALMDRSIP